MRPWERFYPSKHLQPLVFANCLWLSFSFFLFTGKCAHLFDIAVISTGHYLFIETSIWPKGSKAWFIGPKISPQAGKCFQFWYHMYGSSIGQLNVYLLTTKNLPSTPTWSRQKNQGNQWYIAQVSITQNSYVNVSWTGETVSQNGYFLTFSLSNQCTT